MPGRRRVVLVAAALLSLASCDSPTLKSAEEGITIFEDRDYRGKSFTLAADVPDLEKITTGPCGGESSGPPTYSYSPSHWGDCISSIRVPPGWSGTAYPDDTYRGQPLDLTVDIPDLRRVSGPCDEGFNDCISSIRVSRR